MTPDQKKRRIAEIEQDVKQIMMQIHHLEFKVDTEYVDRRELPHLPKIKIPSTLKKLWIGFMTELKTEKRVDNTDHL